jgi:hypothetical protein
MISWTKTSYQSCCSILHALQRRQRGCWQSSMYGVAIVKPRQDQCRHDTLQSLVTSRHLDTNDRFEIGRYDFRSIGSRVAFLMSGRTRADLWSRGKIPWLRAGCTNADQIWDHLISIKLWSADLTRDQLKRVAPAFSRIRSTNHRSTWSDPGSTNRKRLFNVPEVNNTSKGGVSPQVLVNT